MPLCWLNCRKELLYRHGIEQPDALSPFRLVYIPELCRLLIRMVADRMKIKRVIRYLLLDTLISPRDIWRVHLVPLREPSSFSIPVVTKNSTRPPDQPIVSLLIFTYSCAQCQAFWLDTYPFSYFIPARLFYQRDEAYFQVRLISIPPINRQRSSTHLEAW